jgi:uncharacterized membrane protein YhfC
VVLGRQLGVDDAIKVRSGVFIGLALGLHATDDVPRR